MYQVINSDNERIITTDDYDLAELVTLASSIIYGRFHKILDAGGLSEFKKGLGAPTIFEQGPLAAQEIHDLKRAI